MSTNNMSINNANNVNDTMCAAIIEAKDLCFKSGKQYLVNHVNWEVKQGENWVIFGANGSGKTTLLSIVAGFKSPTSGELTILGKKYDQRNIFDLRREVGWVSSSFFDRYYKNETALQIVLSGLSGSFNIDDTITDADVRKAKALLRELRMGEKMNRMFQTLSKGERQNILIARALITSPRILLLDEPCTGLDVYAREYMMNTVRNLAESNRITVLYVTHYPEEIQPFMNKTLLLKHGRIFAKGDTNNIITSQSLSGLLDEPVIVDKHADGSVKIRVEAESNISRICYMK